MRSLPIVTATALLLLAGCGVTVAPSASPGPSPSAPTSPPSSGSPLASPSLPPSTAGSATLVTVQIRGGECPQDACGSIVAVEADGRLHQIEPTDTVLARVPPELLEALQVEIAQANFALIESRPFTDTCPTAYDGQEVIYTFTVAAGTAVERIASCEVAIDENHPLFRAVMAVMSLAGA